MDEKLKDLLRSLKIKEDDFKYFENAKLDKAVYIKNDQKYYIYIEFQQLCNNEVYFLLSKFKNNFEYDCEVIVTYNASVEVNKDYVTDIFNNVILIEYKDNAMVQSLKNIELEITQKHTNFIFSSETMRDSFLIYKNKFQSIFHLLGVDRVVDFVIEQDEEMIQELIEENEKEIEDKFKKARIIKKQNVESFREKKPAYNYKTKAEKFKISQLTQNDKNVIIVGKIFDLEMRELRGTSARLFLTLDVSDYQDSISVLCFEGRRFNKEDLQAFKVGDWVEIKGDVEYDQYSKEEIIKPISIDVIEVNEEEVDLAVEKRVELHVHTKMSNMDGVSGANEYIEQALKWNHKAIAITDHGVVQAFPDALKASKGKPIKVIYGVEAYVVDEIENHIMKPKNIILDDAVYIVFDLETTGLSSRTEQIIEIGAVKMQNGMVLDTFQSFVNPEKKLSLKIMEITSINDDMLKDAPKIDEALRQFLKFAGKDILVAHNASFDMSFLKEAISVVGLPKIDNPVIDTLPLSRILYSEHRAHNLGSVARRMNVEYDEDIAHRADYDARVLSGVFEAMLREIIDKYDIHSHQDLATLQKDDNFARRRPIHMTILAKNQDGIKDLYKLISTSSIDYYSGVPRIPRKVLIENRENLLIGSGCFNGEVFDTAMTKSQNELVEKIQFYDFIEVQPPANYSYLIDVGSIEDEEKLIQYIKFVIDASRQVGKIVVATSDAHYVRPKHKIFRDIFIRSQAIGGKRHPLFDYKNRVTKNPNQHFRTTDEMLSEFSFLDKKLSYEIVVKNSNAIADMIDEVKPLKEGVYTPTIDGAEENLKKLCYETAHKIYGENLPKIVSERIEKELTSIINNGFAVIYYIAYKLVKKSVDDGYLVGSRGSVGSSLVAYLTHITEVNALPPHYVCGNCQYSDFSNEEKVHSGYDFVAKSCPKCGMPLTGEGQDIPFETFLGFKGDKVPDIDLNFSSNYQAKAHEYTKVLFGEDYVYRAGTIGTVAEKTAFGYIKGYFEDMGITEGIRRTHMKYLAKGCEGVKRTTGQHPGGIIVIPSSMDVYDFTPVQFPADSMDADWKTTHFDFNAIQDNVLKLDILGHVDPTALRMLQDMTGENPKDIPCNDEKVLSLFSSCEALGVKPEDILNENGATGIPEFGTDFVKKMLKDAKPKTFAELIQISGLSHGTDVWNGNAQSLIQNNTCTLMEVIGCRDDIMGYLIKKGLDNSLSFKIMEGVRKGRGLTPEQENEMKNKKVPDWYIESCKKIKYMFPKAHAVAYVTMALRIAWFKVYKPLEYYATYFSTRCDAFDIETMIKGREAILNKFLEIKKRKENYETSKEVTNKEINIMSSLESALEMTSRGFKFSNIDLYKSDAANFVVDSETNTILPPFSSIDGLGVAAAISIIEARKEQEFISIEDLLKRTQVTNTSVKILEKMGVLKSLQARNQLELDLF